ncbi:hypothetical protein [Natrinema salifodinae]|uniref:Uncharacterized protein n=1 Tax=Natrinema salifodinae TaxID=1202768 RepID=A0A1I0PHJ0_9EURY|nr:hypothetical protein [Natrinema salifodinae]SEW13883.1 hypothetical protein SAMN05216285_2581 [Natrinema salifodinae]
MTSTSSSSAIDFSRLADRITTGTERLLRDVAVDADDERVAATAAELWDVVAEVDDLLGTVDLENLPAVVDSSALPDLVNPDGLPDAIAERDPDRVLDFKSIRNAIVLRELWNTVDLIDFQREARQLKAELEDVVGADALNSSGDSEAATEIKQVVDEVKGEATNVAFQQQAKEGAEAARRGVIEGHAKFESLYASSGRATGYAGRRPVSKNPTAVSSVPTGPLPAGVSARVSTVPTNVRQVAVDAPPRIYARRWRTVAADR